MNAMKRTLAALVVSGGAVLVLTPVAAHADGPAGQAPPVAQRVVDIVDHPAQTVQDAQTAVKVTTSAVGSAGAATKGADSALGNLPKPPKVE
ncbi:hypothetical protein OG756_17140 [Streptomyces sp. NBC_01310]|uniref:hypothetical protein n=1 Tax=Streptomyces sp. NBC_01310 TaxID=2903820 RepID=UPI0035B670A4|nr:hypothetical protein OG756_17140 [Streptomyces sp. NBC_01310]